MVLGSLGLGTATAPRGVDEEVPSPASVGASGRRLREDPLSLLLLDPRSEDILKVSHSAVGEEGWWGEELLRRCTH